MLKKTKYSFGDRIVGFQSIPGTNRWILFAVVFLAMSFNFILCFLNTNVVPITKFYVQLSEFFIISSALIISFRSIRLHEFIFIAAISLYSIITILIRADLSMDGLIEIQPIRDMTIPVAFYFLGTRARSPRDADIILTLLAIIVVIGIVFEYFFLDTYVRFFNIILYYFARGSVSISTMAYVPSDLYVSGIRPEGRSLLPFLGDHRVSSIFLEPVSPGNFAVILFYWAIVRSNSKSRINYLLFVMSLFITVMSDNRFGLIMCGLGICVSILTTVVPRVFVFSGLMILPFALIGFLTEMANTYAGINIDNTFLGRAVGSGEALMSINFLTWLGLQSPAEGVNAYDSGYVYTFGIIGITGFSVLWWILLTMNGRDRQFFSFRILSALYLAFILCVSYSPYTIKTASVLWFLIGALAHRSKAQLSGYSTSATLLPALVPKLQSDEPLGRKIGSQ